MVIIKSSDEIKKMRRAGKIVRSALKIAEDSLFHGMTTAQLNQIIEEHILELGGYPSFKGYNGFPAAACISLNDEVVHGIPARERIIHNGDIVSIDVGAIVDGYHADAAVTCLIGDADETTKKLMMVTRESLNIGIKKAIVGNHLSDISWAIQSYVEAAGFSVVRDYVGHGIGRNLHEDPQIPNYGRPGRGIVLKAGMTLAIEPMINSGSYEVYVMPDNWVVKTKDGSLSAHFENSIVVTEDGPDVLTL